MCRGSVSLAVDYYVVVAVRDARGSRADCKMLRGPEKNNIEDIPEEANEFNDSE
jgi:hypothetical protein